MTPSSLRHFMGSLKISVKKKKKKNKTESATQRKQLTQLAFILLNFKRISRVFHSVGVVRRSISYYQTYSSHTLQLFNSLFEQRAYPRHVPYCREKEMSVGTSTSLRVRCFLCGSCISVVNLDSSRWLLLRLFLKLLINQS